MLWTFILQGKFELISLRFKENVCYCWLCVSGVEVVFLSVGTIKIGIGVYVCVIVYLCVVGAPGEGHRGWNVRAALGASMVLMD